MWKEKLGAYLIDVSKYVLTGIVIASLFKDLGESKLLIYVLGLLVACSTLLAGLVKEMVKIKPYDLNNVLRNRSDCASSLTTIITTYVTLIFRMTLKPHYSISACSNWLQTFTACIIVCSLYKG